MARRLTSNINTTLVRNAGIIYTTPQEDIELGSDIADFLELTLAALGYDIKYTDFKQMSKEERNQIVRDLKIKTILS
jgi:hypothetical protein